MLYNALPVYHSSYKLITELFYLVKNFTREYKFTLGESLKKESVELIVNIYRANCSFDSRKKSLKKARENVEIVRLFLRLAKDMRQISLENFVRSSRHLEDVSRQLTGWDKSLK